MGEGVVHQTVYRDKVSLWSYLEEVFVFFVCISSQLNAMETEIFLPKTFRNIFTRRDSNILKYISSFD